MALTLPIYVYGNGDLYRELFNAIATVMHTGGYKYLLHFAILLTGTWAIVRYSAERQLSALAKWIAAYYVAFFILFNPMPGKGATVEILDQVNQGKAYAVDNVPLGIAAMASFTSRIGAGLTKLTEQIFSLPDDLKYSQTGMLMASRLVVNASQFQVTDANFMQSMQGFVHQCVFYDLLLNRYSLNDLMSSQDLWGFLSGSASKARSFLYYPLNNTGSPSVMTCETGAQSLTRDWKDTLDKTAARYGARLFPNASNPKAQLLAYLPESYEFLAKSSAEATDIMRQNMMANAIQNGVLQMGATTNSPAALEDYALTKAQLQKRLSNETIGDMAAYWLPLMKNVLEALLYGSFIFVFLVAMFPFGGAVFKSYLGSLLWLQMWAPLYAILNLFMTYYAQSKTLGAMGGADGQMGLSLYSQAGIVQVNADISGLAGYLTLSIPLLAGGLIKGMSSVFTQAAQYIAGVTQGAASGAAGEAVSGNYSLGNLNYNNQSSFNTSANHFDTSGRVSGGMYTTQMSGGSTLSVTPDGTTVMNNQGAISNLGVNANLAESVRAAYTRQAENAETAGFTQSKAAADSMSNALRDIYGLDKNKSISESSGSSWTSNYNAGMSKAVNEIAKSTHQFAQNHNISVSEAASVLGTAYANAGVSGSVGINLGLAKAEANISAGYKRESSQTDSTSNNQTYTDAQEFIKEGNFTHNLDTVQRYTQDKNYRSTNEEGSKLLDSIGASLEHAQSSRNEAMSSFQQAQSYRESASLAEENAVNINSNASQVVLETLEKQGMSHEQIEDMMVHHPDAAQQKASEALQTYTENLVEHGWNHGLSNSEERIKEAKINYDNNPHIKSQNDINSIYQNDHQDVKNKADQEGLTHHNFIDKSAASEVKGNLLNNETQIDRKEGDINQQGESAKAKVTEERARKRGGTSVGDFFTGVDTKDHKKP